MRAPRRLHKSIARLLKALGRELAIVDADIDDAVHGSPVRRETEDLLALVPGIGPIIARTLIVDLPQLGRLHRKKIGALAGLAPFTWRRPDERARRPVHGRHGRAAA